MQKLTMDIDNLEMLGFVQGYNRARPIPPIWFTVAQCLIWGDGYMSGKRSKAKSLDDAVKLFLECC